MGNMWENMVKCGEYMGNRWENMVKYGAYIGNMWYNMVKYGGYIGSFLLGNDDEHAFCILLFGCLSLIVIGLLLFGWFFQLVHFSGPRTGFSRTSSPIW